MLRIGCLKTICHPFQVAGGELAGTERHGEFRLPAGNRNLGGDLHTTKRQRTLTSSVGAKHTPEEEKRIKAAAKQAGLTVSEWARQTHLDALEVPPWSHVLLREIMALRKIVIAVQLDNVQGQTPTENRLRSIIENAESTKHAMADSRLHSISRGDRNEQ